MKKILIVLMIFVCSASCDTAKNRYYTHMLITQAVSKQKPVVEKKVEKVKDTINGRNESQ